MTDINDEPNWGWSMIKPNGTAVLTVSAIPGKPRVKIEVTFDKELSIADAKMFRRALTRAIRMAEANANVEGGEGDG